MSGHSNFEESGEGPGNGSSLFSLFCYFAILLFHRPAVPIPPASPLYRQRCGMVRIPCDIDTRATHTTTHAQNESAGPGNGRRCPGYAVARIGCSRAAMDERALQRKFSFAISRCMA